MQRTLVLGMMLVNALVIGCCADSSPRTGNGAVAAQANETKTTEGIALVGCGTNKPTLENTNPFPVRIRMIGTHDRSELTIEMRFLNAGEIAEFGFDCEHLAFYVYTTNGVLIGFLNNRCE